MLTHIADILREKKYQEYHEIEMAKVPFRFSFFFFFQKCFFSFYFSSWFFVGGFFFRWQFDKNASEKRIAVSSFAVLQCEIPINWADELVCIGFLFFSHRCCITLAFFHFHFASNSKCSQSAFYSRLFLCVRAHYSLVLCLFFILSPVL